MPGKNPRRTGLAFVGAGRVGLFRGEVAAAIISTGEHLHVEPILAALDRKLFLLIEKPLATVDWSDLDAT